MTKREENHLSNYSKQMTKIIAFLLLFLSFMGIIGGIGYTIYYGAWFFSVGLVAVTYLAWPKFKELFGTLTA